MKKIRLRGLDLLKTVDEPAAVHAYIHIYTSANNCSSFSVIQSVDL